MRWFFNVDLKMFLLVILRTWSGKEFHISGNACSGSKDVNVVLAVGIDRGIWLAR